MPSSASTARRVLRSASLYLGLLALFVYGTLANEQFLTIDNQRDVFWQVSNNGIIAVGMTLVILTGGIDLSVGSLLSVGSVVCAMLLMGRGWNAAAIAALPAFALMAGLVFGMLAQSLRRSPSGNPASRKKSTILGCGVGVFVAMLAIFLAVRQLPVGFGVLGVLLLIPAFGLLLGTVNGVIIAKGNLQPFIVTLAMMVSAVGLARYLAGGGGRIHAIYADPTSPQTTVTPGFFRLASNLQLFGNEVPPGPEDATHNTSDERRDAIPWYRKEIIPVPGLFFAASALLAWILLTRTRVGRHIYAVGGNEEAGRYSGLNTDRVKITVYALSGMLSGLAAVLYCAQYQQGKADAGLTRELDAIAAVVIGGTSLMGGRGGIGGTIVGVFIFGYLKNILNLKGVPTEFQQILQGIIIVLAVLLQEGVFVRWLNHMYRRMRVSARNAGGPAGGLPLEEVRSS